MDDRLRALAAFAADLALTAVFVAIGRASHHEDQRAFAVTFLPFAAGVVLGWLVARAWRAPFAIARVGVPVWIATVAVGMVLRVLTGQGVQTAFVVVATIVLAGFLLGWRALVLAVRRSASRGPDDPGPHRWLARRR